MIKIKSSNGYEYLTKNQDEKNQKHIILPKISKKEIDLNAIDKFNMKIMETKQWGAEKNEIKFSNNNQMKSLKKINKIFNPDKSLGFLTKYPRERMNKSPNKQPNFIESLHSSRNIF